MRPVPTKTLHDAQHLRDRLSGLAERRFGSTAYQVHTAGFIFTEKLIFKHPHGARGNCNLKLVQYFLKDE
jgi:hypothetical protein